MKNIFLSPLIIGILVPFSVASCQQIDGAQKLEQDVEVFSAYKMPLVGGANGSRGTKVFLKVRKNNTIELSSIAFESKVSEVSVTKSILDTVWVESYFYERNEMLRGHENAEGRQDSQACILYYNLGDKKKSLKVSSLTLKTDTVLWR
jgi:hypothetical protein